MTTTTKAKNIIMPHDSEAEDLFISCILNCYDPAVFGAWAEIVPSPDYFFAPRHQIVYRIAAKFFSIDKPVSALSIRFEIEGIGQTDAFESVGGMAWLAEREQAFPYEESLLELGMFFAGRIKDAWRMRIAQRTAINTPADIANSNGDFSHNIGEARDRWQGVADIATGERDYMLQLGADDEGNAQCVHRLHQGEFLFCSALGWMVYNGRYWQTDDAEAKIDRAIVDTLKVRRVQAVAADVEKIIKASKPSAANVRNCKALFKSLVIVGIRDFDSNPDLLNCQNGVIDLRTGQLTPHDPDQLFTYCVPVDYDPEAESSEWEAWLYSVLTPERKQNPLEDDKHYKDLASYVQRAVGYSITGRTNEQILFFLYGPEGRNGKGTLTQALTKIFPKPLSAETSFDTFTKDRGGDNQNFDLAPLKAARLVVASESKRTSLLNSTTVKSITGGDAIYCAHKGRDFFNYTPQFKVWLVSNFKIMADADDNALWARIRVIEFPNSYEGIEDKTLQERLLENKPGILAWAVRGAMDWYSRLESKDYIGLPALIEAETKKQRDENDSLGEFLDSLDKTDKFPGVWFRHSYEEWCRENGYKPFGGRRLSDAMRRRDYDYKNFRDENQNQHKGWVKIQK